MKSDEKPVLASTIPRDARASASTIELFRPRLGFVGVGWIGRSRMEAVVASGLAVVGAVLDPSPEMRAAALEMAPTAVAVDSFEALLNEPLDGVVIATPSAVHAEQAIAALDRGLAVFCQKPLARTAREATLVVEAARRADRLLGVDYSYRFSAAFQRARAVVTSGAIGTVYAADLTFHNAYGPDKPWFYDPALSGGGCVMDLGSHLVDMALWVMRPPASSGVRSRLFAHGRPLVDRAQVEDFATASIDFLDGAEVRLACSWNLSAGQDAVISASFYGSDGGVAVHNVNGSFYDFIAERYRGTSRDTLARPPDDWGGRAAVVWAERLANGERYDPAAEELIAVSEIVDGIYDRSVSS